jgi:hypothetical protein
MSRRRRELIALLGTAMFWTTTFWRWDSNGWPRGRLQTVDLPFPLSRADHTVSQEGRSSVEDQTRHLAAGVDKVMVALGALKVVLIGNSRGGNAIRRARLNAPQGPAGDEVTPGPKWMTLRSDGNDSHARPDGVWLGAKGTATHVGFDGPALRGALSVVLPGRDHRETSDRPEAFEAADRFVTGRSPATAGPLHVSSEAVVTVSGKLSGFTAAGPTNLPAAGGHVSVYAVDVESGRRRGAPLFGAATDAEGRWGPVRTDSRTALEFVVQATGFAVSHVCRSPFARSSDIVNFRPQRLADADRDGFAVLSFVRPRAHFGRPRDTVLLDGAPAPGIPSGVAGVASCVLEVSRPDSETGLSVVGEFKSGVLSERIAGRVWPARDNPHTVLELHE